MSRRDRPRAGQRPLRVGEALRHALAEIFIRGDLRDPDLAGASITVTEVRVSPDLKSATAYVTPLGGLTAAPILDGLTRCAPYLRSQLGQRVKLKFTPELEFRLDQSFDYAEQIDDLLHRPEVARDLEAPAEHGDDEPQGSRNGS